MRWALLGLAVLAVGTISPSANAILAAVLRESRPVLVVGLALIVAAVILGLVVGGPRVD